MPGPIVVLCLDAFDDDLSSELIASGRLRGLARLKRESARFKLRHGTARYTGLTWEQFCSGRSPESSKKWSVISFDPTTFGVRQSYATELPFLARVDAQCVVFDVPYFDLQAMPNGFGAVGWGGHDLGVRSFSRPVGLFAEISERFGPPLDGGFLNTLVYPSAERTRTLGTALRASVKKRADIVEWLLTRRIPEWNVALIGFGECHDAIELFYHGVDPRHHLANTESAGAAKEALISVYEEISDQIDRLSARFPDASFMAITMHGMGQNDTDLPTMLLLPELLYRITFHQPLFSSREDWRLESPPMLKDGEDWNAAVTGAMAHARGSPANATRALMAARRSAVSGIKHLLGPRLAHRIAAGRWASRRPCFDVDWMPAMRYAKHWPDMDAFALPGYFDGRVRVNLRGREKYGRVPLERYSSVLDRVEDALHACIDTKTGEPVVREIVRPGRHEPMTLSDTQADLSVLWNASPVGFRHEAYGDIGPGPMRRSGGHSGGFGALYIRSRHVAAGDYGVRSAFDVAPTILELMGEARPGEIDGQSVFHDRMAAARNAETVG